jgi:Ca2+-binding RTX toxin-like protein
VTGNTGASNIDLSQLGSVAGEIIIDGNTGASSIDLGNLTEAGAVNVANNTGASNIDLSQLSSAAGEIIIDGNTSVITIDLGALISTGAIVISDNGVVTLDLSALVSAGGDVTVANNGSLLSIDMPELTEVQGNFSIQSNSSANAMTMSALSSVGGDVNATGNGAASNIDLGSLATVGGSVSVTDNDGASSIDLGSLNSVTGNVVIEIADDASAIDASGLGPGGGEVVTTGSSDGAIVITLGGLENLDGTLTVTSAGGVTLTAEAGLTEITTTGTEGDDAVTGSATAENTMNGGGGSDDLTGGAAADDIDGGEGDDTLEAGAGDDRVSGGAGDDTVVGGDGAGDDSYDGGADIDTVTYKSSTLGVTVDLAAGTANGAEIGSDTLTDIEYATGGAGNDDIAGAAEANLLDGAGGDDRVEGRGENDALVGGTGSDTAVYSGQRSDYTIVATLNPDEYQITDNRAGANDGIDLVSGFELFEFSDGTLAAADILNTAPLADADGPYGVDEDALLSVNALAGVLAGDGDLEGDTLTAVLVSGPSYELSFTLNPDGSFSYQGEADFNGQDSFTYRAFDGVAYSVEIIAQIDVAPLNDTPTANPDTGSAGENETKSFNVLANDTDPDAGDSKALVSIGAVSVSSSNGAVNGILAAGAFSIVDNQIQFSPGALFDPLDAGETATVVVNYTMQDAAGAAASSALTLTIDGAAEGPVYNVINGTPGNDRNLNGTARADLINGLAGNDGINARGGDDLIVAGAGQDVVFAGSGDDTVMATINDGNDLYYGDAGSDTFDFSQTSAAATVNLGATVSGITLNGIGSAIGSQIGIDLLLGFENAIGGGGNDTINGDNLANVVRGGAGNDTISGLRGDDLLFGDSGIDRLIGGRGSDQMTGGADADSFVFQAAQSQASDVDVIAEFVVGQDHLLFQGLSVTQLAERDVNGDTALDTTLTLNDGALVQLLNVSGVSDWHTLL